MPRPAISLLLAGFLAIATTACQPYLVEDTADPCTRARRAVQAAVEGVTTGTLGMPPEYPVASSMLADPLGFIRDAQRTADEVLMVARPDTYWDRLYARHDDSAAREQALTREVTERRQATDALQHRWQTLAACRVDQVATRAGRSIEALRLKHHEDLNSVRLASAAASRWQTRYNLVAVRHIATFASNSPERAALQSPAAIEAYSDSVNRLITTVAAARKQASDVFGDP